MAIKLENRAQKVGQKTLEREELHCVRESVVLKPYSDAREPSGGVFKRRRIRLKRSKTVYRIGHAN